MQIHTFIYKYRVNREEDVEKVANEKLYIHVYI
jgi:hypothetical protein